MIRGLAPVSLAAVCLFSIALLSGAPVVLPATGLSPETSSVETSAGASEAASLVTLSLHAGQLPGSGVKRGGLPARWDWRDAGKVSSVKDQEGCNASYAFAAVADIESKMLIAGADAGPFSENHAKECNWEALTSYQDPSGAKWGTCHQGNARMAANLFSQQGTVLASCDPYDSSEVPCNATCPIQKTVLGWSVISGGAVPPVDRLKESIYSYGPVQTTMYEGYNDDWGEEFSSYDGAYTLYYAGTEEPNHNVLIVGWDDSLSHKGGTGGWIVKNSVGTFWGTDGYFTIAYGSASIGMNSSFFSAWQDYDPEGELLFYDEAGWTDQFGFGNSTAWGLCRFVPDRDGQVSRVEFWTTDATTDVDVYLYDRWIDEVGPRDLLSSQFNLSYAEAGYHSALLDQAVPVTNGDEVVVVLKFTNAGPSYVPPVAIDALPEHSETGRTYISRTGADGSWEDVGVMVNSDIAVRLRLSGVVIPPSATPTPTRTAVATATPSRTPTEVATRGQIYLPVVQRGL